MFDGFAERCERCRGVVWRQHDAARRVSRAFFEVQVGDDKCPMLRPV
jgi:hypothetical protein